MKLIFAIVNNDDSSSVATNLTAAGFSVTKLATTGGFLKAGNTTFIVGTDDEKVDEVIETIKAHSRKRTQVMPVTQTFTPGLFSSVPVEVEVGGATVFVLNVERFEKCSSSFRLSWIWRKTPSFSGSWRA